MISDSAAIVMTMFVVRVACSMIIGILIGEPRP